RAPVGSRAHRTTHATSRPSHPREESKRFFRNQAGEKPAIGDGGLPLVIRTNSAFEGFHQLQRRIARVPQGWKDLERRVTHSEIELARLSVVWVVNRGRDRLDLKEARLSRNQPPFDVFLQRAANAAAALVGVNRETM